MKKLLSTFLMLLFVCFSIAPSYATESFDVKVSISGKHIVENNESLKTGRHTFVLTAKSDSPMPDGSSGNVKKVTIDSNKDFDFGEIHFNKPGTHTYTITRELAKTKNLEEDDAEYTCKVAVFSDGTSVVVFEKAGEQGKTKSIVYTDKYIESHKKSTNVKTGDDMTVFVYGAIGLAASALIFFLARKKKNDDDKN